MSENTSGAKLRATAAEVVDSVVTRGQSLDRALAEHEKRVAARDQALLRNLSYGTLRNHWHLQAWIHSLLSRPLKKRDSCVNSLLAVGLFQLSDTRIPDHAVVSETVEATRQLRRPKLAGLVNAILRRYLREGVDEKAITGEEAEYDHPAWFIEMLRKDWPDHWQRIIAANNERAPMWLRVNGRRTTAASYLADSRLDGVRLDGLSQAVRLDKPCNVDDLPGFSDGDVSVQDAAAQLAAPWLLSAGGKRVLDACAAPGGKTGHLLEILGPDGEVTALDSDAARIESVRQNLDRLRLDATVTVGDASNPKAWWDGKPFDRILLDAPCSATGVIRRHPDIKCLRRESDIAALARLQRAILEALWETLATGGKLLYVTCSVLSAENDAVTAAFLDAHRDAKEDRVLHDYNIRDLMHEKKTGFQVLPGTKGMDGFYFSCLEKA